MLICIGSECFPLFKKQILHDLPELYFLHVLQEHQVQHFFISVSQFRLPFLPWFTVMYFLQRHKQSIVIKPVCVIPAECLIAFRYLRRKSFCRFSEHRIPALIDLSIIHLLRIISPVPLLIFFREQQSLLTQQIKINKIQISCVSRERLIRGISVTGGADGQHLPVTLTGSFQKVHKLSGFHAHRTNSIFRRQRRNMHQDPTAFFLHHDFLL